MKIISLGTRAIHKPDSFVNRPSGLPGYLFLHYITEGRLLTSDGIVDIAPGECLIYPPQVPHRLEAGRRALVEDFVYFIDPDAGALISALAVPLYKVFQLKNAAFVSKSLRAIKTETEFQNPYWQRLAVLKLTEFLILVARNAVVKDERTALSATKEKQRQCLAEIRRKVHNAAECCWSVADMAKMAHLSEPRFYALYKEFFGKSPVEDLIQTRLDRACCLLRDAAMPVKEVADRTGFSDVYYFSQLFRRRIGCPPGRYYVMHVDGEGQM
jgi:AraC-like DNA-binding protein